MSNIHLNCFNFNTSISQKIEIINDRNLSMTKFTLKAQDLKSLQLKKWLHLRNGSRISQGRQLSHDKVQSIVYVTMDEFIDKENTSVGIQARGLLVNREHSLKTGYYLRGSCLLMR